MTIKIIITLDGPPRGKQRHRSFVRCRKIANYTPEETVNYEQVVKFHAMEVMRGRKPSINAFAAKVLSVYPIPASTSKAKREAMLRGDILPLVKPDCDNTLKIIFDAMNKIVYRDDSQIAFVQYLKVYGDKPHVQVHINEVLGGLHELLHPNLFAPDDLAARASQRPH